MSTGVCQVQVVHSDRGALEAILEDLLQRRLIACGQLLGPIESRYRWHGALEREQEWLALLKTRSGAVEQVLARVRELHSYEVPEILVSEVAGGHEPYLRWVIEQSSPAEG